MIKDKIASRIKVISRLNIAEKRVPQDGRMKLVLSKNRAIDFRVSTLPTLHGEKSCSASLDPASATLGIEAPGYDPEQKEALIDAINRPMAWFSSRARPVQWERPCRCIPASTFSTSLASTFPRRKTLRKFRCPGSIRSTSTTGPD